MFKRHKYSALFARYDLAGAEFDDLVAHVKENGLQTPITLLNGEILDGWNRYQACLAGEVEPDLADFHGTDDQAWEYVRGANFLRRHMTPSDRAVVYLQKQSVSLVSVPNGTPSKSVREIAKELDVGRGTAERIATIEKAHDPRIVDALAEGKVSVERAAKIAEMPKRQREAAIEATPKPAEPVACETCADLERRIEEMGHSLTVVNEDNASMVVVFESDDRIGEALGEASRYREMNRVLNERINGLANELAGMTRAARNFKNKLDRLEKQAKDNAEKPF
jgi:hypothetical protein